MTTEMEQLERKTARWIRVVGWTVVAFGILVAIAGAFAPGWTGVAELVTGLGTLSTGLALAIEPDEE
jgi:hypothetical protein